MRFFKLMLCVSLILLMLVSCGTADDLSKDTQKSDTATEDSNGSTDLSSGVPESKVPSFKVKACDCGDKGTENPENGEFDYKISFTDWDDSYEVTLCTVRACDDNCKDTEMLLCTLDDSGEAYSLELLSSLGEADGMTGFTKLYKYSVPDGEVIKEDTPGLRGTVYVTPLGDGKYLAVRIDPKMDTEASEGEQEKMNSLMKGLKIEDSDGKAVLPMKECVHEFAEAARTEASCTADGSVLLRCRHCKDEKTEVITALGHTSSNATCTDPAVCTVCGEETAPATGHDFIPATTEAPKTCRVCGITEGSALPKVTLDLSDAYGEYLDESGSKKYKYRIDEISYQVGVMTSEGKYEVILHYKGKKTYDEYDEWVTHKMSVGIQIRRGDVYSVSTSVRIEPDPSDGTFEFTKIVYLYPDSYKLESNPGLYIVRDPDYR